MILKHCPKCTGSQKYTSDQLEQDLLLHLENAAQRLCQRQVRNLLN